MEDVVRLVGINEPSQVHPRVYFRRPGDGVELTVRFVVRGSGIRDQKDAVTRDVLTGLHEARIGFASRTRDDLGVPPLRWAADRTR